jgi:hypothetical protein
LYRIISPCDRDASPPRGKPDATLRLLAEIEMMRNGKSATVVVVVVVVVVSYYLLYFLLVIPSSFIITCQYYS